MKGSMLWNNLKWPNIHVIGVSEAEEKKEETKIMFEKTIAENFPNLRKFIDLPIQESQWALKTRNKDNNIKTYCNPVASDKGKNLKSTWGSGR
jgi:hypothetical protein